MNEDPNLTPVTGIHHDDIEPKDELPDTILERLHQALRDMPAIQKTGTGTIPRKNRDDDTFQYLEDRVMTPEVRRVLIRNGLQPIWFAKNHEREGEHLEKSKVEWVVRIYGVGLDEDPFVVPWRSEGRDWGDKGFSKAATSARKDFWRLQLMVGGGPENEASDVEAPDAPVTPEQKRNLKALITKAQEQGYDASLVPMPDNAHECDQLLEHLEKVTSEGFQTADTLQEDEEEEEEDDA